MKAIFKNLFLTGCIGLFTVQLAFSQISVTVQNNSNRDIWIELTWNSGKKETPTLTYGKSHTIVLGSDARNITGRAQYKDGLDVLNGMPWKNMNLPAISGSGTLTYSGGPTAVPRGIFSADSGAGITTVAKEDIHKAVQKGNIEQVKEVLRVSDKHVNDRNSRGNTAVHEAAIQGDADIFQTLIDAGGYVNIANGQNKTSLTLAIENKNIEIVRALVANQVKLSNENTNLKKAVQLGELEMVELFLENGASHSVALEESINRNKQQIFSTILADPNYQPTYYTFEKTYKNNRKAYASQLLQHPNVDKNMAMKLAVESKDKSLVNQVLELGGNPQLALEFAVQTNDINLVNATLSQDGVDKDKVIEDAARSKNLRIVEALVGNGATAEKAMPIAVENQDNKMVDFLMENGVMADNYIETAIRKNNESMVKSMINYANSDLNKPLNVAIEIQNYNIAQALVENGAHSDQVVSVAVQNKQTKLLQTVLDQSNASDTELKAGLGMSVDQNNTQYVKMILDNYSGSIDNAMVEKAANNVNTDMITALVDAGGTPDAAMPVAIQKNETSLALFLLDKNADATKTSYITGAAKHSNMDVVKALTERGADVNPALPIAVEANNTQMAKYLLDNGANGNQEKYLVTSTRNKNQELVTVFLEQGVRADAALPTALETNYTTIVRQLVEAGANTSNPSIIQTAAAKCNADIIHLLLQSGAQPDQGIPTAVNRGKASIVKQFIDAGADGSKTAFIQSSTKAANVEVTKVLLAAGADPDQGIENAVGLNNTKLSRVLIDAGASVEEAKFIATAAGNGNEELVKVMLKNGADANNGIGVAIKNNHTNTTMILLYNGADGTSPNYVVTAAKNKNANIVSALIKAGANANAAVEPALRGGSVEVLRAARLGGADLTNPSYLAAAVKANNTGIAGELLEGGSNPNKGFIDGTMSLLHQSIQINGQNMMRLLISKGADVNAQTTNGTSPLMLVVAKGKSYVSYADDLIVAGADVNARDANGEIVFKKAKSGKMKKLLKKSGASKK